MTKEKQKTEEKYVRFGLDEYETQFPYWSKTHKQLSITVKREYEDGRIVEREDNELLDLAEKHKDKLTITTVKIFEAGKVISAKTYSLPLDNLDYIEGNIGYYSNGASNTSQKVKLRLTFLIEDNRCILEHTYKTGGSTATTMYDKLNDIEEILADICNSGNIEDVRISIGEEEDFEIVVANKQLQPDSFEISERELLDSLISVEVVGFDMEINK